MLRGSVEVFSVPPRLRGEFLARLRHQAGGQKYLPLHRGLSPQFPGGFAPVAHQRGNHPEERGGGETMINPMP